MSKPLPENLDELLKLLEPKREVPDLPLIDALKRWRRLAALRNGAKRKIEGTNKVVGYKQMLEDAFKPTQKVLHFENSDIILIRNKITVGTHIVKAYEYWKYAVEIGD